MNEPSTLRVTMRGRIMDAHWDRERASLNITGAFGRGPDGQGLWFTPFILEVSADLAERLLQHRGEWSVTLEPLEEQNG